MNRTKLTFLDNGRWILIILSIAVLFRLAAALYLGDTISSQQQNRIQDQVSYNALANSLLNGRGYSFEKYWYPFTPPHTPTAHWSFLYPLYLAGVYAIFGIHPLAARLFQALISGSVSIWLYYQIGRQLFGDLVGLISAILGAVYAYFIFYDVALMTESFYIIGVMAMLYLTLRITNESKKYRAKPSQSLKLWILLGIVQGITALLRQSILLWIPFMFLWIIWSLSRGKWDKKVHLVGLISSVVVMTFIILPWTVRNYLVYGQFLPLNSNAGYAFYSANHPYHGIHFDQDYGAPLPPDLKGRGLNEAQLNTALMRRGFEFILEDPRRYLLLTLSRVPIFFNFWASPETNLSGDLLRILSFGLYLPFFLFGLILSRQNWKRASLIYLFALVYSLMHILTWASIRYRLPVDAALMPFAALAVAKLASQLQAKLGLSIALQRGRKNINIEEKPT